MTAAAIVMIAMAIVTGTAIADFTQNKIPKGRNGAQAEHRLRPVSFQVLKGSTPR